jgi:hypothetical protein
MEKIAAPSGGQTPSPTTLWRYIFIPSSALCKTPRMFRPGLRSAWDKFARPTTNPTKHWQSFFRPNPRRTLINSSRDNHWPRSPLNEGGKTFNWDAFRWTNYRVASNTPPNPKNKKCLHMSLYNTGFYDCFCGRNENCTVE